MQLYRRFSAIASVLLAASCANHEPTPGTAKAEKRQVRAVVPPDTSTRIRIPEGSFDSGTEPGSHDRLPELEPRVTRLALGPFEIDVDAYETAPGQPLLGASLGDAIGHCRNRGGRLCTELEWERACKGPASAPFATGTEFDPNCETSPERCASAFGVRGLGSRREWTASDLEKAEIRQNVLRGASPGAPAAHHRCAHRSLSGETSNDVAFRCCYGPPNAAKVNSPGLGTTFSQIDLSVERLSELLGADPTTREFARDVRYFEDPEASRAVLEKGPGDTKGFLLTTAPLLWNPIVGAEFLVVTARSGPTTSLVATFHVLEQGRYRLASSFVMRGEPGPVALAYNGYIRPRLHFSSCWGCPGETGKILYRDPDQTIILQP